MRRLQIFPASLTAQIFTGLGLGILTGVFFGELAGSLNVVANAFIRLMQMTVLPYIAVSLILALGQLSLEQVKFLAVKAGKFLLILWAIALFMIVIVPLTFPVWESASFFSTTLIEQKEPIDFVDLYIPANPFHSLANNVVPSVVLFSIAVGLALVTVEDQRKTIFLDWLAVLSELLMQVTKFVGKLIPIGVFAIAANASGTMGIDEFSRLQIYVWTFGSIGLLVALWILPGLLTTFSPLRYWDVVGLTRDVLVLAFATGNVFFVLALMSDRCKAVLSRANLEDEEDTSPVDVLIPAAFNFPNVGKLMTMSFILFAGWYSGSTVSAAQYPILLVSGLMASFGQEFVTIPFLLDLLQIPVDMFQLYLAVDVFTGRFADLMGSMHIMVIALLGTLSIAGLLTFHWRKLIQYGVVTGLLIFATIGGLRLVFTYTITNEYRKDVVLEQMQVMGVRVPVKVHQSIPPPLPRKAGESTLAQIRKRGFLRVGYIPDQLPFSFKNGAGELVGFDIQLAHYLASDLKVDLEFVPIDRQKTAEAIEKGCCDILMSGMATTPEKTEKMIFTKSHLQVTLAFLVPDHRREEFSTREAIQRIPSLKIGAVNIPYYIRLLNDYLPNAAIVRIDSNRDFFSGKAEGLEILVTTAEAGSAWSLLFPNYSVAIPKPDFLKVPLAYAVRRGDTDMLLFMNTWLDLRREEGTIQDLFDYWVLGKGAAKKSRAGR
jgi:Na+/H+-dicarboxylate symporter/ABC-type amino acid transport substrate-binding protein